ncbi:MAG: hypothetical protein K2H47_10420, partial [Muribaculaceae bacterium]|nr:hypothetical protein [Muribaculaceae bacterium]
MFLNFLLQAIQSIAPFMAGGGFGWFVNSKFTKQKNELDLVSAHLKLENSLTSELADKSKKIRELQQTLLDYSERCHKLEMQLASSRCDRNYCRFRLPPFSWMTYA